MLCGRRPGAIRKKGKVHREDKQVGIKRQSPKLNIEKEKGGANGRFCYQNVISTSSPTRPVAAGPRIELPIPPALTPPGTAPPTPPSRPSMAGGYVTTSASARWSISDVKGSSGLRLRASWYESMAPSRSPSRCLARPRAEYPAWLPCFFCHREVWSDEAKQREGSETREKMGGAQTQK